MAIWGSLIAKERSALAESSVASVHNSIGMLMTNSGRPDEALASYREALKIHERLVAENPSDPVLKHNLATSFNNIALLLRALRANQTKRSSRCARGWRSRCGWRGKIPALPRSKAISPAATTTVLVPERSRRHCRCPRVRPPGTGDHGAAGAGKSLGDRLSKHLGDELQRAWVAGMHDGPAGRRADALQPGGRDLREAGRATPHGHCISE